MRAADGRLVGVIAAGAGMGIAELVAGALGSRSVFTTVADAAIAATPGPIVRLAIAVFGGANRLVLVVVMAVVLASAGSWAGGRAARRHSATGQHANPTGHLAMPIAVFVGFAVLAAAAGLTDPLVAALPALLAPTAGMAVGLGALWLMVSSAVTTEAPSTPTEARAVDDAARRRLLTVGTGTAAFAVAAAVGGRWLARVRTDSLGSPLGSGAAGPGGLVEPANTLPPPAPGTSLQVDGLSPLITPNDAFFRIDTAFTIPRVDVSSHQVRISGLVGQERAFSYADLLAMADTEADVTLSCVSNEVGGDLVGTARWQGVPLRRLLEQARVRPEATQVVGRSVEGWTSGFPVEAVFDGRPALVAVGMNGEPLPRKHGYPVRLVVAGLYGYVCNTKWLEEIELTTFEAHDAYWVPRGWAERAPIKTQSRIDVPRHGASVTAGAVTIAGVAWADEHGVSRVEVAVDSDDWQETELTDPLAQGAWRQWRITWDARVGDHQVRVRAFDANGEPQTDVRRRPAPDGATGHHTIRVNVV
jgi:DMSO/TMAO reductase YedYZ molybdopterin-dependent catalytic subunit